VLCGSRESLTGGWQRNKKAPERKKGRKNSGGKLKKKIVREKRKKNGLPAKVKGSSG